MPIIYVYYYIICLCGHILSVSENGPVYPHHGWMVGSDGLKRRFSCVSRNGDVNIIILRCACPCVGWGGWASQVTFFCLHFYLLSSTLLTCSSNFRHALDATL